MCRAASALETRPEYRSGDYLAPRLLPAWVRAIAGFGPAWRLLNALVIPAGIYPYVIARTRYIDVTFVKALEEGIEQVLIFGAGFDTRALRFQEKLRGTQVFELDVPVTQRAKIRQYGERSLTVPANLNFIEINFDKEALAGKLEEARFEKERRSLFVLEGLLMYLQPESVDDTLRVIREFGGKGSRLVFDYVYASVLRGEATFYGETGIRERTTREGEQWQFGIEKGEIEEFLKARGMRLLDHKDAAALEREYFTDHNGNLVTKINGTHCLAAAEVV